MERPGSGPKDTIPSIKAEMNVNSAGGLSYTIPIESLKGINNFQPNVALGYNSQSGNGQAGWGWNVIGLSMITQGGKSKYIDGITIGPQFNTSDPFYLDGQRLLMVSSTVYETEKYSKIKVTKPLSGEFSFIIQYTDGKIAKYKQLVSGQHYISVIIDALNNEIHYTYTTEGNVANLSSISYGGATVATDKFSIHFIYKGKIVPTHSYRNGAESRSAKILSEIHVKSTYLTINNGIYRKYRLVHDYIQSMTAERLTSVEIENEKGTQMKPLKFGYNTNTFGNIEKSWSSIENFPFSAIGLGTIVVGDFFGTGSPYPIYEVKFSDTSFSLHNPKSGPIQNYTKSRDYFSGRILRNNRISDTDDLIGMQIDYTGEGTNPATSNNLVDQLLFDFRSLVSSGTKEIRMNLKGGIREEVRIIPTGHTVTDYFRDEIGRNFISGDFNNDGLVDMMIVEKPNLNRPQKIYFVEMGLIAGGTIVPGTVTCPALNMDKDTDFYQIELDGDAIPELLVVYKKLAKYSILKFNPVTKALTFIQQNITLSNFTEKTPLIFGDFNGDGLTDFTTPQKIYSLEGSNAGAELNKMETDQLLWWHYTSTGTAFLKEQKNYTAHKLAYIASSQRNVIKRSSDWDKFWSGKPDSYAYTEYAMSTILPVDFNNDGKTDLISVRKFGKAKYDVNGRLGAVKFEPLYTSQDPASATANRILFHETRNLVNGKQALVTLTTRIGLASEKISPLSLILNNSDYSKFNTYKSGLMIHDPLATSDLSIHINNDEFLEGQLTTVDNGGPVQQKIEYRPMIQEHNNDRDDLYTFTNLALQYPYYVHKNIGTHYLVYKIHTLFDGKIITKEHRYQNGIQHLDGKGFIGFQKTFVSDPYESTFSNSKYSMKDIFMGHFWKINIYDPLLENTLQISTYGSLNENSIFSKSVVTSNRFAKANNRYLILPTIEKEIDYLKGTTITKTNQYGETDLLLEQVVTNYNNVGSSLDKFIYDSESQDGQHYHFGRIKSTERTMNKDGASFTTKEEQFFNPNGSVYQTKKYGNNTLPIVTDFTYYPFGELMSQSISSEGIAPITTTYEYEATNRFLWKTTAPDLSVTTANVNIFGKLLSETSALGLTTSYKYDNWGNVKQITNFLGKSTFIKKNLTPNEPLGYYSISTKSEGGIEVIEIMDIFDRKIKTKTQSINGQWIVNETEYDVFGKTARYTEPYFEGSTKLWTSTEYDEINRPIKQTSFTGRILHTCYEGLKVTVEDGHKKTSKWLDAMGNNIKYQDGGGVILYKYYPNGDLKETNYEGIVTRIEIDGWGNKKKLEDPSAGPYLYNYDNLGRLKKEINPKGGYTEYNYNNFGKLLSENTVSTTENTNITKNFLYDPITKLPTVVTGTYNGKIYTYTTSYDQYFRVTKKSEETPDFLYETTSTYDDFGRVDLTELKIILQNPSHTSISKIKNVYDSRGLLVRQDDPQTSSMIWELNSITAQENPTQLNFGNGYVLNTTYNTGNLSLEHIKHFKDSKVALDITYDYSVLKGTLLRRNNLVFSKNETYQYDDLDRLLRETVNNVTAQVYTYDKRGRMTYSQAVGKYNYNEENYKLESIDFNTSGTALSLSRGFAEIQYNTFKNPNEIILAGKDIISFDYSVLGTRSASYYGSLDTSPTQRPNRKFYSSDNAVEIVKEGNITKIITYITGDAYSANYMKVDVLTGGNLTSSGKYFLHRDNQQTIMAITRADTDGTLVERRYFDAWGNLKGAKIGASNTILLPNAIGWIPSLLIDRGYTGHEHLKTVGLIHMNGRIYDPVLRRFMSPDDYVQDEGTQNFNRYGYVFNSPLLYTDPGGEFVQILIGVAIAVVTNGIINSINGVPFWYGAGKAGMMGAVSGVISIGIGSMAVNSFSSTINQGIFQAGMHGVTGGMLSELQGGKFLSGFAAGAISSMVASGVKHLSNIEFDSLKSPSGCGTLASTNVALYKATMIATGGLSGGISSSIAGGNFWMGVQQGVIVAGLNHLASHVEYGLAKHKFDKEIDRAFATKADKIVQNPSDGELLRVVKMLPTLNKFYEKFLTKFSTFKLEYKDILMVDDGRTYANYDTKTFFSLVIYRGAMSSYRHLSHIILHEFGHVNSIFHGFIFQNAKKYTTNTAIAIDEIYAYKFGKFHGGTPFGPLYEPNVNFLKNTTWQIKAESLKLPSFD